MRESSIQQQVVSWAEVHGMLPIKMSMMVGMGEVGWPDYIWLFLYPAVAFIEFKAPGKEPTEIQKARMAELQVRGYPVKVIDNVSDGIAFLEAEVLSRTGRASWDNAGVRGLLAAARYGQNDDRVCDYKDLKKQIAHQTSALYRANQAHVQRLAPAKR